MREHNLHVYKAPGNVQCVCVCVRESKEAAHATLCVGRTHVFPFLKAAGFKCSDRYLNNTNTDSHDTAADNETTCSCHRTKKSRTILKCIALHLLSILADEEQGGEFCRPCLMELPQHPSPVLTFLSSYRTLTTVYPVFNP